MDMCAMCYELFRGPRRISNINGKKAKKKQSIILLQSCTHTPVRSIAAEALCHGEACLL